MDLIRAPCTRRHAMALIGAAVLLRPGTSPGETKMLSDNNLRMLAQLEGPIYRSTRDELFRRGGNFSDLTARYAGDPDWRVRMTAAILQGWTEQRGLYEKVQSELDRINPAGRSQRLTGMAGLWEEWEMRAHLELREPILPLAWEGVAKLADSLPAWRTAAFLAMISGVPSERSIEPVAHVIETSAERLLRERAALALSKLPRESANRRLAQLSAQAEGIADAVRTARDLME